MLLLELLVAAERKFATFKIVPAELDIVQLQLVIVKLLWPAQTWSGFCSPPTRRRTTRSKTLTKIVSPQLVK